MSERQFRRNYGDYDKKYYVNAVELAQKMIFDFVRDYFGDEKLNEVKKVIDNFPIHYFDAASFRQKQVTNKDAIMDDFFTEAYVDSMQMNLPKRYTKVFAPDLIAYDTAIITTIHEYGHILRRINSKYGSMFEEGFVTIFAEACYTNYKLKTESNFSPNEINISNDGSYAKAESQVRAILYFLNQKNLDISLIGEYIFGNENKFISKCVELFGEEFTRYFHLANSSKDQYYNDYNDEINNSEILLVNILSNYINNKSHLENNRFLYRNNSLTLSKSISKSNIDSTTEEDNIKHQRHIENTKYALDEENEEKQERMRRIREYVFKKCNLDGKRKDEIYDIILDICMEYIKRNTSNKIENKIFIQELKSYIPRLDEIVDIFRTLRANGIINLDFSDLKDNNFSYDNIYHSLKNAYAKLQKGKLENIKNSFDYCNSRDSLLNIVNNLNIDNDIVKINDVFPNYSNFVKYVLVVEKEIPEVFDSNIKGYNSIYEAILKMYLLHQEKELNESKRLENEYKDDVTKLDKQFRVIENSNEFEASVQIDEKQQNILNSLNTKIDEVDKNNKSNEDERNSLYSEHSRLKNKNFIIRLFQRKKIRDIEIQIKEIEDKIEKCNDNIKELENDISNVKKKIKDNENSLLEKYGISISEYKDLLYEINSNNLTEEEITKKVLEINKKIQSLNIQEKEKEIQDIYVSNNTILNREVVIQQDNNFKK